MKTTVFDGLITAVTTPFPEDDPERKIDWKLFRRHLIHQAEAGADGIVVCGTTGESPTLRPDEHNKIVRMAVDIRNSENLPIHIIAGTGSNSTRETCDFNREARECGADGVMIVMPYYNLPPERGLRTHFQYAWIEAGELPVCLYDHPGRTGIKASAEFILELANEGFIQSLKWASGDFEQLEEVLAGRPAGFTVMCGDDDKTEEAMLLGADGTISVSSNLVPALMKTYVRALGDKDHDQIAACHQSLAPLFRELARDRNPIPIKEALKICSGGAYPDTVRSPLAVMKDAELSQMEDALRDAGFLDGLNEIVTL